MASGRFAVREATLLGFGLPKFLVFLDLVCLSHVVSADLFRGPPASFSTQRAPHTRSLSYLQAGDPRLRRMLEKAYCNDARLGTQAKEKGLKGLYNNPLKSAHVVGVERPFFERPCSAQTNPRGRAVPHKMDGHRPMQRRQRQEAIIQARNWPEIDPEHAWRAFQNCRRRQEVQME